MAEPTQIVFSHKEVTTALIKQQGIHEGIWGIHVKFGLRATNVGTTDADILPAAVVPIIEIGLQKFDTENNLSVDAAKVNPKPALAKQSRKSKATPLT
ncbi:MAG: hypothetical protein HYX76_16495 [Acidobacteria bacterium]|nr:hypothetical protein [Acidobacteriota bacterium]